MPILSGVVSSAVGVPGAPTIGTVTISGTTATVPFTAPVDTGGSTITSYTAVSSPSGITGTLSQAGSGSITVSGLSGGTSYTFTVFATNAFGNSPSSSASNSVTASNPGLAFTTAGGYGSYNGARFADYAVSYSNDNVSYTAAFSGTASASGCGLFTNSGTGSAVVARYWRYVVTNTSSHHPRCSRIFLNGPSGPRDIIVYTSDNCADSGGIPALQNPATIIYDAATNTTIAGAQGEKMPGYLSNRLVAFIPAEKAVVDAADLVLQDQIDDLSLNLGVQYPKIETSKET